MADVAVCADCGAQIEALSWSDKFGSVPRWAERRPDGSLRTTCRVVDDWSDPENPRCLAADYHYVAGEEQRRFTAP